MTATVRIATPDDAALLHEIAAATFALACPPGTTAEAVADFVAAHLSAARFAGYLAYDTRDLLLVEVDGAAVGYTMLTGAHGTGAAAVLMQATLERARHRGAAAVWLGVNQHNPRANRFYEKCGFATVGTKRFLVGGKWEDDFVRMREI